MLTAAIISAASSASPKRVDVDVVREHVGRELQQQRVGEEHEDEADRRP